MRDYWQEDAACRGMDAEIFYPDPYDEDAAAPALAVCAVCTVREICLETALAKGRTEQGVWGGHTEAGRRRMIRKRRYLAKNEKAQQDAYRERKREDRAKEVKAQV